MQKDKCLRFGLVASIIIIMGGLEYSNAHAQFEETHYLTMELINGQENQFIPGQTEYKIGNIQTNATDLQGLVSEQTQHTGVAIDDNYLSITALLNLPRADEPNRLITVELAAFLDVTAIDGLEENGIKTYELTKTPNNYNIFGHLIMDGVLTQTTENNATLSLRIS